ncbi:MAG: cation diffusion facilitator family transporter [Dehalococcoidia bacterium]
MASIAARPSRRTDIALRAALLSVVVSAALLVLKIAVGLAFGSVAVLGDGVDSAEDLLASGLTFFTVRLALQPADDAHPYGHGKAESLSALSQAALIAGGAVFITIAAIRRLVAEDVEITVAPSLAAMAVTAAANIGVAAYAFHAARVSGSVAVAADARHLLTNIVQALAVIAGLVLVGVTGDHVYDPIVALFLAAYLAWIAARIARSALSELIDTALPPETVALIEECLAHEGHGMRGFHNLRTRKSGRQRYIDLHVLVDPAITVSAAHVLVNDVERHLRAAIRGAVVTVHVDPDEPEHLHDRGEELRD